MEDVCMTTFAFVNNMLLAASLQGPAGEEAKDTVRVLTKSYMDCVLSN